MKDFLNVLPSLAIGLATGVFAWRQLGGWRGIRTPRIAGPLTVAALGFVPVAMADSVAAIIAGVTLTMGGMTTAGLWWAIRSIQLQRALQRLDPYVQGSEPFPFPQGDTAAGHDVALVARLMVDPALAHGMDPLVVERIGDLQAGRTARSLPGSRS